jgi:type I restriction enzyme, S subunit
MIEPRLRFKEFSGGWDSIPLGKITETITSGSRDWAQYYSKDGSKFIRMTNLSRDGINLKLDDLKFVNIKSNSTDGNRTSLIQGDILISITAELGKIGWIPPGFGEAFINQHTALVRIDKAKAESKYVAYLLSTPKLNKQINRKNDAGAKAGLNLPTIKSIKIQLPELNEQTKIANFLTAVDEKITQLTQKCDLLTQYKKGVMQQIFSQELRFKDDDGRDFPKWEEKKITNLIKNKKGALKIGPFGSELKRSTFVKTGFKVYGQENIFVNDFNFGDRYITEDHFNKLKANVLHHNDFVISTMGTIGKCAIVPNNIGKGIMDSHMIRLQLNEHIISSDFLSQIFGSYLVLKQVKRLSVGGIMDGLSIGIINELKFFIPSSLKEQTKIANFLAAIDDKINNAQAQLAAVKQYKQGLLQQMFV